MEARKLALLCRDLADNRKAEDIVILDVRKTSSITDFFVICTGTSEPHLRAIFSEITDTLQEDHGVKARALDGGLTTAWVVLDFFDVIVHLMRKDVREQYRLEELWGDAPKVKKTSRKKTEKAANEAAV